MKHLFPILILALIAAVASAHPSLLFTDGQLKQALADAQTDPLRAALHARIVKQATLYLTAAPAVHPLPGEPMLDEARLTVEHVVTCAMAYRLTGDLRFAAAARRNLTAVAKFADWNPSHFLDVGEFGFAVGLGYDWLYPILSPEERALYRDALLRNILSFAPAAYASYPHDLPTDPHLNWVPKVSNWNAVCNGGMLTAALALRDEQPDLAQRVVAGVRHSFPYGMSVYEPEGAYPEGPSYWNYGTTYATILLTELEETQGTDFGLGSGPGFRQTALYRLVAQSTSELPFSYADCGERLEQTPAYTWVAQRFGPTAALARSRLLLQEEMERSTLKDRFFGLDAVWFPRAVPGDPAGPLDIHLRGHAELAIFRSDWKDKAALFLGFKAGTNGYGHSDLDLGSFVLDADGVRWSEDLGRDNYNLPGYFDFSGQRQTYFRKNNRSHSTVTLSDALQGFKAAAPITDFGSQPRFAYAVSDLSAVYPKAGGHLRRGVALIGRSQVLVQDEWDGLNPGQSVAWSMMTAASITPGKDGGAAVLTRDGRTLDVQILEPASARFSVRSAAPPTKAEEPNDGYRRLTVLLDPAPAEGRLVVLLRPRGPRWPASPAPTVTRLAAWPGSPAER